MALQEIKSSGLNANTPKTLSLISATIHEGLKYTGDGTKKWNFEESLKYATSGGTKVTLSFEITKPQIDGMLVEVEGMDFIQGGQCQIETNRVEITSDLMATTVFGEVKEMDDYDVIEPRFEVSDTDYVHDLGVVGRLTDGRPIIVLLESALCESGLELETKDKNATVIPCTYTCKQLIDGDLSKLPVKIYIGKK